MPALPRFRQADIVPWAEVAHYLDDENSTQSRGGARAIRAGRDPPAVLGADRAKDANATRGIVKGLLLRGRLEPRGV